MSFVLQLVFSYLKGGIDLPSGANISPCIIIGSNCFSNISPLSANPTKWLNALKQFVGSCLTILCDDA